MRRKSVGGLSGLVTGVAAALAMGAVGAGAADWPMYGGPNRDGISNEADWKVWTGEPRVAWKAEVGQGYSTVSVAGERVYTMGGAGKVWCLNAADGATLWSHDAAGGKGKGHSQGTPSVAGGLVHAVTTGGTLLCLGADDGALRWRRDLAREYGVKWGRWDAAVSPLVLDNRLVLDAGRVIVLNRETGALIWQAGSDTASYCSAVSFTAAGRALVTSFNAEALVLHALDDGREVARHPWKTPWDVNAATPVVDGDRIFISSGYDRGCALLRIEATGLSVVRENKDMSSQCQSSVLYKGCLYGVHGQQGSKGSIRCIDFATGKVLWTEGGLKVGGGLMIAGGRIVAMLDGGDLLIADAVPDAFRQLARGKVLDGKCWTVPVLCGGRVYCRSFDGALACVDLR